MASEEPTDWINDAGWLSGLYETAQRGNRAEFDAILRRLLYEHGASVAAQEAPLRAAVEGSGPEPLTEAIVEVVERLNLDGWVVVPDPNTDGREPMQERLSPDEIVGAIELAVTSASAEQETR